MFTYNAKLLRVIDGDTVALSVDLGFNVWVNETFRLARIDTPELRSKDENERVAAKEAKQFVVAYFEKNSGLCVVRTSKGKGKYGRWIAEIFYPNGSNHLNEMLLEKGLAKAYE